MNKQKEITQKNLEKNIALYSNRNTYNQIINLKSIDEITSINSCKKGTKSLIENPSYMLKKRNLNLFRDVYN